MQPSILTCILQSKLRYAAQSLVLGQVQQQQINSVRYNNNTAISSLCVLCGRRGIVDYDVIYSSTYRRGLITSQELRLLKVMYSRLMQGRREPNVGPGPAQMTDFRFCELQNRRRKCSSFSELWCDLKKRSSPKF